LLNDQKWSPTTADRSIKIEYIKNIFKWFIPLELYILFQTFLYL
jgi:hypothetical protein